MDLRTQVANLRPVAAAPAAKPGGSPAPTACAPDAPVAPTKNETGSLLEGSFSVGEQQPGVMFDPGSTAKVMAFPYAHFLSVEGTAQELEILFSTHKATVKGLRLLLVMESLRAQTLKRLSVLPKRYEPLAQEKGTMPIIQSIVLEKQEDEDTGGGGGRGGDGGKRPRDPSPAPADEPVMPEGDPDLDDVEPPEHAITGRG